MPEGGRPQGGRTYNHHTLAKRFREPIAQGYFEAPTPQRTGSHLCRENGALRLCGGPGQLVVSELTLDVRAKRECVNRRPRDVPCGGGSESVPPRHHQRRIRHRRIGRLRCAKAAIHRSRSATI
jgi:hypothetical protein